MSRLDNKKRKDWVVTLWQDSQGRFICNVPPQPEEPSPPSPISPSRLGQPNRLQCILAATMPLTSSTPVSDFISNIAIAFQSILPEQSNPSPPPQPIPPCTSSTPPLLRPDFNASGSDKLAHLNNAFFEDARRNNPLQVYLPNSDNNRSSDTNELVLPIQHPQQAPSPFLHQVHFEPIPTAHSQLVAPLPSLPSSLSLTLQHPITMLHGPTYRPAAMPSTRSTDAPFFLGKIEDPIEDFLQESDELAESYNLTNRQKVETVIWYVHLNQHDIWKTLEGYINCNWNDLCCELHTKYVSPTKEG